MKIKYELLDSTSDKTVQSLYRFNMPQAYLMVIRHTFFYTVAKHKDKMVGAMSVMRAIRNPNAFQLLHVVVNSDYRGKGIGKNLIYASIKHCIDCGAEKIINLKRKNDSPFDRIIFDEMGFEDKGRFFDGNGVERIYFEQTVENLNYYYLNKVWKDIWGRKWKFLAKK